MNPRQHRAGALFNSQAQPNGNGALPGLETPQMPGFGFDPRGYFPGYTPQNRSSKFTASAFLSLGAVNEVKTPFADLISAQEIAELRARGKVVEPPSYALTIAPCSSDLIQLTGLGGQLDLYYKIEYTFDGGFPSYYEGLFNQPNIYPDNLRNAGSAPTFAAAFSGAGYKQLSQRGIRQLIRGWGFNVSIYGQGTSTFGNWQTLGVGGTPLQVRFDMSISPVSGQSALGANSDPYEIGNPSSNYLPMFSKDVKIITPNGVAAQVFSFVDLNEATVQSYATGDRAIPIPARAVRLTSASVVALFGEVSLY